MLNGRLRHENRYLAVKHFHEKENWSIKWMCGIANISRAAYYKWLKREITPTEKENILIAQLIREYDDRFGHIMGYRRMRNWINRINSKCYGKKRIYRIMRCLGIRPAIRRKARKYVSCSKQMATENILKRDFYASKPNEKWVTDVTEFKVREGKATKKLYLSVILDLYDRSVVAYEIRGRNDNTLVLDTLAKAMKSNPDAKPLLHSDRGFQYTSRAFQYGLDRNGLMQSMSRAGRCIDNGPMEGFWGIIKSEMFYLNEFSDAKGLKKSIIEYIDFFNNGRFQERFGNKSPMEVRAAALGRENPPQYPIAENKRIKAYKEKIFSK